MSVLADITSTAAAITPVAGDVGEVAKLADDVVLLVTPAIKSAEFDKPTNEYVERLSQYEQILQNPNEATREQQLGNFVKQLCLAAGISAGFLSGGTIRVPLEHFTALVEAVGQLIKEREQAAANAVSKQQTK